MLEYVVLSVLPATSVPKKKLYEKNSFCTTWHLCTHAGFCCCCSPRNRYTQKPLIWCKEKKIWVTLEGHTFTHNTWPFISFLLDLKKEAPQQSNTHTVTSAVKRSEIQIFHTRINWVEALVASKHREKHNSTPLSIREVVRKGGSQLWPTFPLKQRWVKGLSD